MRERLPALGYLGVRSGEDRLSECARQVLLANLASVLAAAVTSCYQIFYLIRGVSSFADVFLVNVGCLAGYLSVPWLNHAGRFMAARHILVIITSVQLFLVDYLLGIGTQLFYFVLIGMLPLLYRDRPWIMSAAGISLPALFLVAYFYGTHGRLPDTVVKIMYAGNVLGAMGMIIVLVHLFNREILRLEGQLSSSNLALRTLSATDQLTGIANRRGLEEALDRQWVRIRREQRPLSILMCDIDAFKSYNDHYGHPAGDSVLRTVAAAIRDVARQPSDLVARYGGEEFAVVLPGAGREDAIQIGERVIRAIRKLGIAHDRSRAGSVVTISIGIATMKADEDMVVASLIEMADRGLYRAKRAGGDCVRFQGNGQASSVLH